MPFGNPAGYFGHPANIIAIQDALLNEMRQRPRGGGEPVPVQLGQQAALAQQYARGGLEGILNPPRRIEMAPSAPSMRQAGGDPVSLQLGRQAALAQQYARGGLEGIVNPPTRIPMEHPAPTAAMQQAAQAQAAQAYQQQAAQAAQQQRQLAAGGGGATGTWDAPPPSANRRLGMMMETERVVRAQQAQAAQAKEEVDRVLPKEEAKKVKEQIDRVSKTEREMPSYRDVQDYLVGDLPQQPDAYSEAPVTAPDFKKHPYEGGPYAHHNPPLDERMAMAQQASPLQVAAMNPQARAAQVQALRGAGPGQMVAMGGGGGGVGPGYQMAAGPTAAGGRRLTADDIPGEAWFQDTYEAMPAWMSDPLLMRMKILESGGDPRLAQLASQNWHKGANIMPPSDVRGENVARTQAIGGLARAQEAAAAGLQQEGMRQSGYNARSAAEQEAADRRFDEKMKFDRMKESNDMIDKALGDYVTAKATPNMNMPFSLVEDRAVRASQFTGNPITHEQFRARMKDIGVTEESFAGDDEVTPAEREETRLNTLQKIRDAGARESWRNWFDRHVDVPVPSARKNKTKVANMVEALIDAQASGADLDPSQRQEMMRRLIMENKDIHPILRENLKLMNERKQPTIPGIGPWARQYEGMQ